MRALGIAPRTALAHWLDGQPSLAAGALDAGLASVGAALNEHVSVPLMAEEIGPLFRLGVVPDFGNESPLDRRDRRRQGAAKRKSFGGGPQVQIATWSGNSRAKRSQT